MAAANMGFARCGVEGNLREIIENTRKKIFHFFSFFVILKNGKSFCCVWISSTLPVAVARTSQSPCPLPAIPLLLNEVVFSR